jgi:uncharacterized protein
VTRGDARPANPEDRVVLIDALRGAALFGVLLMNMQWFAGFEHAVDPAVLAALPTAVLDDQVAQWIDLLIDAKAIGIFSFLFGVGFALQLEAMERKEPAPLRRYSRRLVGLLLLGVTHWLAIWSGEILHVYAVAGFLLMALAGVRTRTLVAVGLVLAVFARPLVGRLYLLTGGDGSVITASVGEMAARFHAFAQGGVFDSMDLQLREDVAWQLTSGSFAAAVLHALGRFMIGIAAARTGMLSDPAAYRRPAIGMAVVCLPMGFVLQHDWWFAARVSELGWIADPEMLRIFEHCCGSLGVVSMTAGYVALFMLCWQMAVTRSWVAWLAPAGRMALTNYLSQTLICYLLFFGFGMALMGRVGVTVCAALSVAVFLAQVGFSHWWLARYRFGPFEWMWRWWTYGVRPALRRVPA